MELSRPDVTDAAIQAELERILSSGRFHESVGLKRFLRYTVEHTLRGEGGQLKEYRLGLDVFDRDSSFDPRVDPVVRMAARRLRAKLREYYEDEGGQDPVRIDVPKGSYAAEFGDRTHAIPGSPTVASADAQSVRLPARRRSTSWPLVIAAVGVAALVIGWAIGKQWNRPAGAVSHQIHSVAVLPLQNLSADPSQEFLADGITEELVTDLAQVRSLRVISRTSVMTYKGTKKRLPEIARELNVDAVVEGSVMRSGNRVQVTAQLIEASSDTHLWAQTYEGKLKDLLTLENEVAQAIVQQVGIKLTPAEQGRLKKAHLATPKAYEAYLLGRFYWNKRTTEGFTKAVEYFQQASKEDPGYSAPYAGLADSYLLLAEYTLLPSKDVLPKAREAAVKALELDEELAEAHASLGAVKVDYEWDWRGAEQEFRRAIELNPGYATAHQWCAELLSQEGRHNEAISEIKRARQLDPLSLIVNTMEGRILVFAGLTDEAIEQLTKTLDLDPNFSLAHYNLGKAYLQKGDLKRATTELQESAKLKVAERSAALAFAYVRAGKNAEARDLLAMCLKQPMSTYVSWYGIAIFYSGLGDQDRAFASLEKAYTQHDARLRDVKEDPFFASLHSDPRFAGLVQSLGL